MQDSTVLSYHGLNVVPMGFAHAMLELSCLIIGPDSNWLAAGCAAFDSDTLVKIHRACAEFLKALTMNRSAIATLHSIDPYDLGYLLCFFRRGNVVDPQFFGLSNEQARAFRSLLADTPSIRIDLRDDGKLDLEIREPSPAATPPAFACCRNHDVPAWASWSTQAVI